MFYHVRGVLLNLYYAQCWKLKGLVHLRLNLRHWFFASSPPRVKFYTPITIGFAMPVAFKKVAVKFGFFGFDQEKQIEFQKLLKNSVESMRENRLSEAHQCLEQATELASKLNKSAESTVQLLYGNFLYKTKNFNDAAVHFTRVLELNEDVKKHPALITSTLIEATIRLADIYILMGEPDRAEEFYLFALESIDKRLRHVYGDNTLDEENFRANPDLPDVIALKGLLFEGYGHFLLDQKRFEDGDWYYNQALSICNRLYGTNNPKCLHMLHDYANGCVKNNEFEKALSIIENACTRAIKLDSMVIYLPLMYTTYAKCLVLNNDVKKADVISTKAIEFAKELQVDKPNYESHVRLLLRKANRDARELLANLNNKS